MGSEKEKPYLILYLEFLRGATAMATIMPRKSAKAVCELR